MESLPRRSLALGARRRSASGAGFTLIELLVVAAIIAVLAGIIFSSQSSFSNSVLVTNTAYDVALSARDAETYGLGTRVVQLAQGATTNAGYGLHFSTGAKSSYMLFADNEPATGASGSGVCHPFPKTDGTNPDATSPSAYPGNCMYDATGAAVDTLIATYALGNGMTISNICAIPPSAGGGGYSGILECSSSCGSLSNCSATLTALDIIYLRPNATPYMSEFPYSGTNGAPWYMGAGASSCIAISSPDGKTQRAVKFSSTGQIEAGNTTTCP